MKNKSAIITGASRGIGAAAAEQFARGGFDLALSCIHSKEKLDALAKSLRSRYGVSCLTYMGDMGQEFDAADFIAYAAEAFGAPSVLVNNAGISKIGLLSDTSLSDWEEIMRTNVTSVFLCTKAVLPYMLHEKSGSIINVSSVWGSVGASCEAAYSASKGAVDAFTKAMAKELAPSGIAVNAAAFGAFDTDMNSHFSKDELAAIAEEIPSSRLGTPKEAAQLIYSIAMQPPYLTGQVIRMDGGWF